MSCELCGGITYAWADGRERSMCQSCITKIRRYRVRLAAIDYLGGKCSGCGWQGPEIGYDIHHKNPEEKEIEISKISNKSWDFVKIELDKCELLCVLCHRMKHSDKNNKKLLEAVQKYKGRSFDHSLFIREQNHCVDCGTDIDYHSTRCKPCTGKLKSTKIHWPEIETLLTMIKRSNRHRVAKTLGVSETAVRKRLAKFGHSNYGMGST